MAKTETVALGIPVNEISVKYLRKYVDKAWAISEDSDEIMETMVTGYSVIPLPSADEPGASSCREGVQDIAAYLNVSDEQLMYLLATYRGRYNYDDFRQVVLFNIPRYKIPSGSLEEMFKNVVDAVGSGQQEVMFTGSICRVMNVIRDGGKGYGLDNYRITRLSKNSGLINDIYLRELNTNLVVARRSAAAGKKTKTSNKRQFSRLKRDCSAYTYARTFEIIQDCLRKAVEESIAHHYSRQTPKGLTAHVDCCIHPGYTTGRVLGTHKKITGVDFLTAMRGSLSFKNKHRWDSAYSTPFSRELESPYKNLVAATLYLVNLDRHGLHPVDCFEDTNGHMQIMYRRLKPAWPILKRLWEYLYTNVDGIRFNGGGFTEKGDKSVSVDYYYTDIRRYIIDEYRPGCLLHSPAGDGEEGYINKFIRNAGEKFIPYRDPKKEKGKK